jgi:hypothetical protein
MGNNLCYSKSRPKYILCFLRKSFFSIEIVSEFYNSQDDIKSRKPTTILRCFYNN